MKTVGFIGLGTMGTPMANNLIKAGFSVIVYNRTREKAIKLEELGAKVASSPMQAASSSDVLITMLSDDRALDEVYFGDEGIIHGVHAGLTVIDSSTVAPETSQRIYQQLHKHDVKFLDAPVTGSTPAAIEGTLVFMVGGQQEVMDEHMDVFQAMGKKIIYMGESGSGSRTKLAMNTIVGINLVALSEGLSIVAKSGIDVRKFLDIVLSGAANSRQAELKGNKILNRDFSNQFSLKLMLKDLRLARQLTQSLDVPSPVLEATLHRYQQAFERGWGEEDLSSVIRSYEEEMGIQVDGEPVSTYDPGVERRSTPRVPLQIQLHISVYQWEQEGSFKGQDVEGILYDLSSHGLQIITNARLSEDMFIVIHFPKAAELPPLTAKIIRVDSKDQENNMYRYGCILTGTTPQTQLKLDRYIEKHLAEKESSQ